MQGTHVLRVFYHADCLLHETGRHPERPERLEVCERALRDALPECGWCTDAEPVDCELLRAVHTAEHVQNVVTAVEHAPTYLDPDTPVSRGSLQAARRAAGLAVEAVRQVIGGDVATAFCLIRPPGHHATRDRAMGFCLFNNVAVAARWSLSEGGLERVLIVDFDVHHGNGTQDIFYEDDSVLFFSIHRYPFYPGTGSSAEDGAGRGKGYTRNVPVAYGTPPEDYLRLFRSHLDDAAAKISPQLVLVSAGFDAHRLDPIGSLGLDTEHFEQIGQEIARVARSYCGGRTVSVLEGGYNLNHLGPSVVAYLRGLQTQLQ